jgi:hypothetical protein
MVSDVDRVEVFNESTSGWIRVRGRQNFDAALSASKRVLFLVLTWPTRLRADMDTEHLRDEIFYGRFIFADGRNATESIMIRKLPDPVAEDKASAKASKSKVCTRPFSS